MPKAEHWKEKPQLWHERSSDPSGMTGRQLDNQRAWDIICTQYSGIEKWQRIEVYEQAVAVGTSHEDALELVHGYAKGELPEVEFQANDIEMETPKLWDTGLLGLQGE